jgi:hypothetical protein
VLKHFRHINEQGFLSDEHLGLVRERPSVESALEDLL